MTIRKYLVPSILVLLAMACATSQPTPTITPESAPGNLCGNGLCTDPENSGNCPEDCTAPQTEAAIPTVETPARDPDLTLTIGAPNGQIIRPLLGVNVGPLAAGDGGNPDVTGQYHQIGVNFVRTHDFYGPLDMATLFPDQNANPADPTSYDFARSDEVFAQILAGGFQPYLRIGDSYNNGLGYPEADPRQLSNPANWTAAVVEVVRHYRELSEQAGIPLRYVEIWNEPNHRLFWDGSPGDFYTLFAQTAIALKAEFPDLMIGGPGFSPAGYMIESGQDFSRGLVEHAAANNVPLDFLSWHIYANEPQIFADAAAWYRDLLDSNGYTSAESHITEWNTEHKEGISPDYRVGPQASAITAAAWIALQQQGVEVSTFYRGTDPSMDLVTFLGMFYANGESKPAALAFDLFHQISAYPQMLSVMGAGADLWVLAGKNDSGETMLLVVNMDDSPLVYSLAVENAPLDGNAPVAVQQIGGDATAIEQFTSIIAATEIGPYTVQLVTFDN